MNDYGVDEYGRPVSGGYEPAPQQEQQPCPEGQTRQSDGNCKLSGMGEGTQTAKPVQNSAAGHDSKWLNWIDKTYGTSKSRGGGFADLPAGTNMGDVVNRFNADTGSQAKYNAGPSGDRVDFGDGVNRDVLTSEGQLWYNYGPGGPPGGGAPQGGGAAGGGGVASGGSAIQRLPINLPQDQLPTYKPGQVAQFAAPDQSQLEGRTRGIIDNLLTTPTFSEENIAQMKERQKEQAMKMAADQGGVLAQHYGRLGRADSGEAAAGNRDLQQKMISDILSGNREVDLNAAESNRGATERAVGLSGGFMNDVLGRATQGYDTTLRGALSQEDLNRQGVQSEADRIKFNLQRAMSEQGLSQDAYRLNQDDQRIAEMIRQFNGNMNYNYGKDAQSYNQWLVDKATR